MTAACSGLGFAVFYGAKRALSDPEIGRAKTICNTCQVQRSCLSDGLLEDWGIWGGYTRPERARALEAVEGDHEAVLIAFDRGWLDQISALPDD